MGKVKRPVRGCEDAHLRVHRQVGPEAEYQDGPLHRGASGGCKVHAVHPSEEEYRGVPAGGEEGRGEQDGGRLRASLPSLQEGLSRGANFLSPSPILILPSSPNPHFLVFIYFDSAFPDLLLHFYSSAFPPTPFPRVGRRLLVEQVQRPHRAEGAV